MAQSYNCIAIAQEGQSSNCQVCLMTNQKFIPIELFSHHICCANELWAYFLLFEHKYKVWMFSSLRSIQFAQMQGIKDLFHQSAHQVQFYTRIHATDFTRMQLE